MNDKPKMQLSNRESIVLRDICFARMKVLHAGDSQTLEELPHQTELSENTARQSLHAFDFFRCDKRFYRLDLIERVEKYERLFDEAIASHDPEKLRLLDEYYTSGAWREDYEADERGELPPDLKRGVLSQDALYDLLEEYR